MFVVSVKAYGRLDGWMVESVEAVCIALSITLAIAGGLDHATGHYAVGVQLISVVSTFRAFFVIDRRQVLHQIGPGITQPFTVDGFVVE